MSSCGPFCSNCMKFKPSKFHLWLCGLLYYSRLQDIKEWIRWKYFMHFEYKKDMEDRENDKRVH